jgi:hypothetical protein
MTKKIYKTAMGKTVDLGSLILQNEEVRAVGNMNVNARGDVLDSSNQAIDKKNRQVQRQYSRQATTNVQDQAIHSSTREAKQAKATTQTKVEPVLDENIIFDNNIEPTVVPVTEPAPVGGLAAALAKSKSTKTL